MARKHYLVGGAAAFLAAATIAACTNTKDLMMTTPVDPLFKSYASLGNSITAGYQSGGINDSTQKQSYAVLFAAAAETRFAIPALAMPGCAPPVDNFNTQTRVTPAGYPASTSTSCYLRVTSSVTPAVNNVAVPGAASVDPTALTSANSNALTTFILGGFTQDQRALLVNPTFLSVWIGNNDILANALSGCLVPTASCIATGVTSQATFMTNYNNMTKGLKTSATLQGGVLFAVINVTNAPLLFHANLLNLSPAVRGRFEAAAGTAVSVDASCDNAIPLISFQMASYIRAGTLPPVVICKKGVLPAPVGDLFVLDSVEVPAAVTAVTNFNVYIKAKADTLGWAYVDMNPTLLALKTAGAIPPFPDLTQPTKPFGDYFSLDGVHPSALAHKTVANLMIDSVNAHYGTALPAVP